MTLVAKGQRFTATVRDEGEGFDPNAEPDPTAEENLLNTSGRGLLLMRAFVDEIKFRQRHNGGMEIILSKVTNHGDDDNREHEGS